MAALFAASRLKERDESPSLPILLYVAIAQVLPPVLSVRPALSSRLAIAVRTRGPACSHASWSCYGRLTLTIARPGRALAGMPFLSKALPSLPDVITRLALPSVAIGIAARRADLPARLRTVAMALAALFAAIAAHTLFKQLLAIDSLPRFDALGYVERTLWEAQLAALALLAWQWRARSVTIALAAAALAHFAWYSLLLHNPLWDAQAAGGWIIPAYALAFGLLWATQRAELLPALNRARDWARMLLIPLLALSLLRWAFAGSILSSAPTRA